VEKPFGRDLASASALNRDLNAVFDERQVYRIDHYLGKETVQNIMVFRFANGIMEPIWNRGHIDHVQITVSENLGLEGRGAYFEEAGACRDIVQNHMLQLLCLVAMEPPVSIDADAVRDEKVKVLRAVHDVEPYRDSVRAQYAAGSIGGERVMGYREEEGVSRDSRTETYVALRLFVDSWRWADVPFYIRTGKRLPRRVTEIALQFKAPPLPLFKNDFNESLEPNVLVMRIQPDEGISLKFLSKTPGPAMRVQPVKMDFRYGTSFGVDTPEAYERLLLDAMLGDSTLFTRRDEVEAAWRIIDPIIRHWEADRSGPVPFYEAGTWGPSEADDMVAEDGRRWRRV
jgi:glucose-6-phosphate 1-dehydrogenase